MKGNPMSSRRVIPIEDYGAMPLFAGCSRRELQLVSGVMTRLELPAGKVLAHEGERPSEFVVVLDGTAEGVPRRSTRRRDRDGQLLRRDLTRPLHP